MLGTLSPPPTEPTGLPADGAEVVSRDTVDIEPLVPLSPPLGDGLTPSAVRPTRDRATPSLLESLLVSDVRPPLSLPRTDTP